MTQKISFTREAVIEAAFTLAREKGWGSVTARSIAKKLGSSTMPIYSSLKSMEEIESEVRARAEALLLDFQRRVYTGDVPLDQAVGYVTFARDERSLFRFLYVERPAPAGRQRGARETKGAYEKLTTEKKPVSLADQVPVAMSDSRILKSWIFTHGLASLVSSGVLELPDDKIQSLLLESGAAFSGGGEKKTAPG
ncbi:MAG: TetR/AcrR family transcriptional regulator [Spirochaetia bacterium]|jgi:AcrR family transcriptional regulator